jgi:EAL domain-containing protein (putative c-di-GMP-specific phosphodiesterase class I)
MPDKLVRQNSTLIKKYKALLEKYNIDMGLFEFIGESVDYQYLQDLRPVYIKGETDYFLSQSDQALSALRLITDTVGISLIAAGVMDMNTLTKLQEKDIYIIQGKATEMIELA